MLLFIIAFIVLMIGIFLICHFDELDGGWLAGLIMVVFGGIFVLVVLVTAPVSYYRTISEFEKYNAMKQTILVAREKNRDIETAAIQLEIIKINKWIANTKYWNNTIFDWWFPDKINELAPLE